MIQWEWLLLPSVGALVMAVFFWAIYGDMQSDHQRIGREQGRLRAGAVLGQFGTRYEIALKDWGDIYGERRWRWCVFDAEHLIKDPIDYEPLADGLSETQVGAYMEALSAVQYLWRTDKIVGLRAPAQARVVLREPGGQDD